MSLVSKFLPLAGSLMLALPATPALAQKAPPTLLGRWATYQIRFSAPGAVPDSTLAKLDNPDIIDLNGAMFTGEARLVVEFRPDSSYEFTIVRGGKNYRTETGTYSLRGTHLNASAPASPDGSSFHDQQIQHLTRRNLVLSFSMGPGFPGVDEEVEYHRVGPVPTEAQK